MQNAARILHYFVAADPHGDFCKTRLASFFNLSGLRPDHGDSQSLFTRRLPHWRGCFLHGCHDRYRGCSPRRKNQREAGDTKKKMHKPQRNGAEHDFLNKFEKSPVGVRDLGISVYWRFPVNIVQISHAYMVITCSYRGDTHFVSALSSFPPLDSVLRDINPSHPDDNVA